MDIWIRGTGNGGEQATRVTREEFCWLVICIRLFSIDGTVSMQAGILHLLLGVSGEGSWQVFISGSGGLGGGLSARGEVVSLLVFRVYISQKDRSFFCEVNPWSC